MIDGDGGAGIGPLPQSAPLSGLPVQPLGHAVAGVAASAPLMWGTMPMASSPPIEPSKVPLNPEVPTKEASGPGLFLPPQPVNTSVWGQPASHQDYRNKAGWSVPPPPLTAPLFPVPQLASGIAHQPQPQAQPMSAPDPRFSFSPDRLMHLWPR